MPLYVSGKRGFYLVCCCFRGCSDWDAEAQQLLRMCQTIRAYTVLKKKRFNHFLLLFHSYDTDVCASLPHTNLRRLWSEQKSGWIVIRELVWFFSTVWIRCWRISLANAFPSPRRCCFITCSQLRRTSVLSCPRRFLRALFCGGTVPFPDCPRSFNERRHCGVILPRALFVFLFRRMWILTNVNVEKVKRCKNAIFSFVK